MSNSSFSMDDYDNISNYRVTQAAHGFAKGDVLRTAAAGTYAKAQADSDSNSEVCGICSEVIDANTFKLRVIGRQTGLSGLVADTVYFLSHVTAGALTTTDPATIASGFVSKPVILTDSTTSGVILTYRGINDGGAGDAGPATLDGISDVNAPSPTDQDILTWDNASSKWINQAAAGGGGGKHVPLLTQTISSSTTSVDFTTSIDNTYESYLVVFREVRESTTNSNNLLMGISSDNGSSYDFNANYPGYMQTINDTGTLSTINMNSSGCIICPNTQTFNGEGGHAFGQILIRNMSSSGIDTRLLEVRGTTVDLDAGFNQDAISYWGGARRAGFSPINALSFKFSSGTILSGVFTLYGVAEA